MNDRLTDITFTVIFLLILCVFVSWSFDTGAEQVIPMDTGAYSDENGARRAVSSLRGFLFPGKASNSVPEDFTIRLRDGVTVNVDTPRVVRLAEESERLEIMGAAEKRRLIGILNDITRTIEASRFRLGIAKKGNFRSAEEISAAEKALDEMILGAALLSERINTGGTTPLR